MTFGWRSILLLLGVVQGVVVAGLLFSRARNRQANRYLAILMLAIVDILLQQMLGFAGAYDRAPWLILAPFDVSLAFGPLLLLYMRRLLTGPLAGRWWLHLIPGGLQFLYYAVLFPLPLATKLRYVAAVNDPYVVPIETLAALVSAFGYWWAAASLYRRYHGWVPGQVSDSENYHLDWLRNLLAVTVATFALWLGFEAFELVGGDVGYRNRFWLFLWAAGVMYYLGLAGYRHASLDFPEMQEDGAATGEVEEATGDWRALAASIEARVDSEEWFLDPDLTLDGLARRLGTNTWTLSRAINLGTGLNFNDFVNRSRVRRVQRYLAQDDERRALLDLALACGFNSKTSFNRSFKKLTGETPSAYRARVMSAKS